MSQWMRMWPTPAQGQPPVNRRPPQQQYGATTSNDNENRWLWISDLQDWMDENYLSKCFNITRLPGWMVEYYLSISDVALGLLYVKVMSDKQTHQHKGYGLLEFRSHAAAETVLYTYYGVVQMPNTNQYFRRKWATDGSPGSKIFVGGLAGDVTDHLLETIFSGVYWSVQGAEVVMDNNTGCSKGYGFVMFGDEREQQLAMTAMNGVYCLTRPMRIGPAAYSTQNAKSPRKRK